MRIVKVVNVVLLLVVLVTGVFSTSARRGIALVLSTPGPATQLQSPALANFHYRIVSLWDKDDNDGDRVRYRGNEKDKDGDKEDDKDKDHGPSPAPEPSTLLSFGAALLIGCGVIYSRRMFANRK